MATTRINALQKLANQLPVANQQVATGLNEARKTQLQASIAGAQTPSNVTAASQQVGAQQAQQAGQVAMQQAQQTQNQVQQVGQMGLQEQARGMRQVAHEQGIQETRLSRDLGQKLSQLDSQAKRKILDSNLSFKMDEAGRALLNTQQLVDWAAMNAKSDEDFQNKVQDIGQAYDRKIQMMQAAARKLKQLSSQGYTADKQKLDNETRKQLAEQAAAIEERLAREKARANNTMMTSQGIGTLVGMGVGAYFGGPAGASAGGAIGGGVGTVVGSQTK